MNALVKSFTYWYEEIRRGVRRYEDYEEEEEDDWSK